MPEEDNQLGYFVIKTCISMWIIAVFIVGGGVFKAILMTNKETSIEEFREEINSFWNLTKADNERIWNLTKVDNEKIKKDIKEFKVETNETMEGFKITIQLLRDMVKWSPNRFYRKGFRNRKVE